MSVHWGGPGAGHVSRWSVATTGVPVLSLDFVSGTILDSRITFSRTTNATLVDATGKLTYAPNNLVTYSEQFEAWTKVASTIAPNTTVAPNNTTTADKLVEDTSVTTGHFVQPVSSGGLIAGQFVIYSVYAKAGERTFVQIILTGAGPAGVNVVAGFDLINGTAGTPSATTTSTITSVGNGWYRCSIAVPVATTVSSSLQIRLALNSTATPSSYTGDGVSGLFIWGAQLEAVTYQTTPSTYVQTVASAYYGPRFDYNPVTLAPNGLLIEEQRVNSLLYSDQFDNGAWSKANGSVTANTIVSPDGTTNADAFIENTAVSAFHYINQSVTKAASSITYAASFYIKNKGRQVAFNMQNAGGSSGVAGRVNPATGAVTANATAFGTGFTAGTLTMTDAGNGWYRVVMTVTSDTSTSITLQLALHNGTTNVYTGDGVSGLFIWGAQLEAGAFVTSYIPTVASTVTRAADIAVMTGTNFSNWYNQTEGTLVAAWAGPTVATVSALGVASVTDGTINERITMRRINVNTDVGAIIIDNNVVQANLPQAGAASGENKTAVAYLINDVIVAANGTLGPSDTSVTLPTVTQLEIGFGQGITYLNGYIRTITYYPSRLTDAQLQALTA